MTKVCTLCSEEKPIAEFSFRNKSKGTRRASCKECQRERDNAYYKKSKKRRKDISLTRKNKIHEQRHLVWEYLLENPCVDCGESDPVVLEFDHVRGEKSFEMSELTVKGLSNKRLFKEIEKCDVRCANCHRRKTAERGKFYSWLDSSVGRTPD